MTRWVAFKAPALAGNWLHWFKSTKSTVSKASIEFLHRWKAYAPTNSVLNTGLIHCFHPSRPESKH